MFAIVVVVVVVAEPRVGSRVAGITVLGIVKGIASNRCGDLRYGFIVMTIVIGIEEGYRRNIVVFVVLVVPNGFCFFFFLFCGCSLTTTIVVWSMAR